MMNRFDFSVEPFNPHPLMRNSHVQTLSGNFYRKLQPMPHFRRARLETPDDDFIDIDFAEPDGATWEQLGADATILFLLHGLEGNAQRGYAVDTYRLASQNGYRCVGMNYRSCSDEMNRQPRFYHMGATEDVKFVHEWLLEAYPDAPMVMIGMSLGGNILLKYFGELGDNISERVIAGVAMSPPFIATGTQKISDDRVGKLYGTHLTNKLKRKVRQKADMLYQTDARPYDALKAKTLRDFDDAITAPLNGFDGAQDYYAQTNSINFLDNITRPTLLIRAQDDPFFNADIPYEVINQNPYLYSAFPKHGGHIGFLEGTTPKNYTNWAHRQAIRFFDTALKAQSS